MLKKILVNAPKPQGFWGKVMLLKMNIGHGPLSRWGLKHIYIGSRMRILDIGCGGGRNIKRMLKSVPKGYVYGLDYADLSVKKSRRLNKRAIVQGRAEIVFGNVENLLFEPGMLDIVTAFETIYFWPDLVHDMKEVYRVLKPGGVFLICNEAARDEMRADRYDYYIRTIGMKIYSEREIKKGIYDAGFGYLKVFQKREKGWICVAAYKEYGAAENKEKEE
jgi:ubiquinone/menaquinone biosynthesis C-methylase UbiE